MVGDLLRFPAENSCLIVPSQLVQVFNDDITGPDGSVIEVTTVINGSFNELSGNVSLRYGADNATWPLPFNATADEVEEALEARI